MGNTLLRKLVKRRVPAGDHGVPLRMTQNPAPGETRERGLSGQSAQPRQMAYLVIVGGWARVRQVCGVWVRGLVAVTSQGPVVENRA